MPLRLPTYALSVAAALVLLGACAANDVGAFDTGNRKDDNPNANAQKTQSSTEPGATSAGRKHRHQAIAFIHGTSDHGDVADLKCSGEGDAWHCISETAVAEYWTQPTIDSERTATDGSQRPYIVIGCPLSAQTPWPNPTPVRPKGGAPEPGSAACVAAEISTFLDGPDHTAKTDDDIDDVVLITHSGGSNVVRYILQQHSARPAFDRVHAASRGFIGIAAPTKGTYLADRVFRFGVLSLSNTLFGAGYDDDGVDFIQTAKMTLFNQDPAKLVNLDKDVAGVPSFMASGSFPDLNDSVEDDTTKTACGGESETKGLQKLHQLYLAANDPETFRDGCSDGFITCQSAMALANGDPSRVVFGKVGETEIGNTHFRAHNQSRRDCNGLDIDVRNKANAILESASKSSSSLIASAVNETLAPYRPNVLETIRARFGRLALSSASKTTALRGGDLVRVKVEIDIDLAGVAIATSDSHHAFLRDPSGKALPVTIERATNELYAVGRLPPNAAAGVWTMHVAERSSDIEQHLDARLPLLVTSASTDRIVSARAELDPDDAGGGVIVRIVARTSRRGARIGARATLVSEDDDTAERLVVTSGQSSVDATSETLELSIYLLPHRHHRMRGKLVVRDVALVSHDDASTLDYRDRVDVN